MVSFGGEESVTSVVVAVEESRGLLSGSVADVSLSSVSSYPPNYLPSAAAAAAVTTTVYKIELTFNQTFGG